jgi:pantoate--beta-alanine ligase
VSGTPAIITTPAEMQAWSAAVRARGARVAFVPTMGYLHEGHVSLLRAAHDHGDAVVLSIFVNPTQFGPREDLSRYPRDLPGDLAKAASADTAVAYVPEAATMYPPGYQTYVQVRELEQGLCGEKRPNHFVGVATVVLKLFNAVQPHAALFGEKDFQQLAVIRRMTRDLDLPITIIGRPTVREPDGLAMSSRNSYLSPDERTRALALSRALFAAREAFARGERDGGKLLALAHEILAGQVTSLDYLELRDAETLAPLVPVGGTAPVRDPAVLAVAAFVGRTRLIDNVRLDAPL